MKPKTIEHMQHFVGKICTIFTHGVNRNFDEKLSRDHFVVRVGEITVDSVWGLRLGESGAAWFRMDQVISIQEEQELNPDNPEHKELIDEYENRTGKKMKSDIETTVEKPKKSMELPIMGQQKTPPPKQEDGDTTFVDIESLEELAKNTKQAYDMLDMSKNIKR